MLFRSLVFYVCKVCVIDSFRRFQQVAESPNACVARIRHLGQQQSDCDTRLLSHTFLSDPISTLPRTWVLLPPSLIRGRRTCLLIVTRRGREVGWVGLDLSGRQEPSMRQLMATAMRGSTHIDVETSELARGEHPIATRVTTSATTATPSISSGSISCGGRAVAGPHT